MIIGKKVLKSFINKYYLGGLNNQVKWRIKDNQIVVYANSTSSVFSKTTINNFEFEDAELGIFDTQKLLKLTSILGSYVELTPVKIHKMFTKLSLKDESFDLIYTLADTLMFGKVSYPNYGEGNDVNWDVELDLSIDDINNFIKSKNALDDVDLVTVKMFESENDGTLCRFTFGTSDEYSNKISYNIQGTINKQIPDLPFNSEHIKEILSSNKDMETAKIKIVGKGLMKFEFSSKEIASEYYLIRNE